MRKFLAVVFTYILSVSALANADIGFQTGMNSSPNVTNASGTLTTTHGGTGLTSAGHNLNALQSSSGTWVSNPPIVQSSAAETQLVPGAVNRNSGVLQAVPRPFTYGHTGETLYTTTGSSAPRFTCTGADGRIWVTYSGTNKVAAINQFTGSETLYSTTGSSAPYGICLGPKESSGAQRVWVCYSGTAKIAAISTTGAETLYSLSGGDVPYDICSDGTYLWATLTNSGQLARISTSGTITKFTAITNSGQLQRVAAGPDGLVWTVGVNSVAALNSSGTRMYFDNGLNMGANYTGLAFGPDGNMYMVGAINRLASLSTNPSASTFRFNNLSVGGGSATYQDIKATPQGTLLLTDIAEHTIKEVDLTGTVLNTFSTTGSSAPYGLSISPIGDAWVAYSGTNRIGKFPLQMTLSQPIVGLTTILSNASSAVTLSLPNSNSTTVVSDIGASNNFLTAISSSGSISKARPTMANITDPTMTTVSPGSAGSIYWTQPFQFTSYKKVIVVLSGYTNAGSYDVTFTTPFTNTPVVTVNSTGTAITTLNTTKVTIPAGYVTQDGVIAIEGI